MRGSSFETISVQETTHRRRAANEYAFEKVTDVLLEAANNVVRTHFRYPSRADFRSDCCLASKRVLSKKEYLIWQDVYCYFRIPEELVHQEIKNHIRQRCGQEFHRRNLHSIGDYFKRQIINKRSNTMSSTTSGLNAQSGQARATQLQPEESKVAGVKAAAANANQTKRFNDPNAANFADSGQGDGFAVTSQVNPVRVEQVDHNAIAGSNKGDHRGAQVKADPRKGNEGDPREQMHEARLNSKLDEPAVFRSTDDSTDAKD